MPTLKIILNNIRKELQRKDRIRDESHKKMRKATSLAKQAILLIHQKRLDEAERLIKNATETLSELRATSSAYLDIIYGGMFSAALQEYSEAIIFFRIVQESRFLTPKEINVPSTDYVLGLADAIGECRRLALDALREGKIGKAENCLHIMDEVYIELMAMDESYMLVPGLRRKCDVARKIIETTRGDVTQDIGRSRLEKRMRQIEKEMKARRDT